MKRILIIGVVIIVATAFAGALLSSRQTYEPEGGVKATTTSGVSTTASQNASTASPKTESDSKAICVSNLEAEVARNKTSYEKGTILISFDRGTEESQIATVLKDHSLAFESRTGATTSPQIWGTVKVKTGSEFTSVCTLRADPRIKYAGLNPILELHE